MFDLQIMAYRLDLPAFRPQQDTPIANLSVILLDRAGVPIEKLGDSTGPLKLEPLSV
jgi:hypothetical protein